MSTKIYYTMNKKNTSVGIWGYGIVGKAAVNYFLLQEYQVSVMDRRELSVDEYTYLKKRNVLVYHDNEKQNFFTIHDILFSSPGIQIMPYYALYKNKWIHELDIFGTYFKPPIVAITGSVGKTSCTHIISSLLNHTGLCIAVGGNIGIATFDLLQQQNGIDYGIIEVSSFQLEHCLSFAPYLAIITNIYPNHLDRHGTEESYFSAKSSILARQQKNTYSLVPWHLKMMFPIAHDNHHRSYFSSHKPHQQWLQELQPTESVYYWDNKQIYRYHSGIAIAIFSYDPLHCVFSSFDENILIVIAACDILKIKVNIAFSANISITLPEHRFEYVTERNGVTFYNDSKATTTNSTLAAVDRLLVNRTYKRLHLFIGGLSKGVDRSSFIDQLKDKVDFIYCFGAEADQLYAMSIQYAISAQYFTTLDSAFDYCMQNAQPGDCILLSPAGSSYDLYENYEKRGEHFKKLIAHSLF